MRLVAVTKILDEADIVEAFARHTAHYVSHHIFLDNGSVDGTVEILRRLRDEGLGITVLQNGSRWFNEAIYNTFLYFIAVTETAADWVTFLDADEFIDDRQAVGGLATTLAQTHPSVPCVRVMLTNYHPSAHDNPLEPVVPLRIGWVEQRTDVPKVIVRGNLADRNVVIEAGSHGVLIDGGRTCPYDDAATVTLAHYPERSPFQTIAKVVRGWSRVLAAGQSEVAQNRSVHYRSRFDMLRDSPQDLLQSAWLHQFNRPTDGMTFDPITYHGGPLRFTQPMDEGMRAVRSLVGYLELLSREHGRLLDECPGAREMSAQWATSFARIIG